MRISQLTHFGGQKCVAIVLSFVCVALFYVAIWQTHLTSSMQTIQQANAKQVRKQAPSIVNQGKIIPAKPLYNLMEEKYGKLWMENQDKYFSDIDCTIESANEKKLQQDHPCLIHLIQNGYIRKPAPRSSPYHLDNWQKTKDPSDGQSQAILRILRNQTNGFFIESGANDGEFLSNTLYMERYLNWTGLLVEPDINAFNRLINRNRKAYTLHGCLSTKPYPMKVLVNTTDSPLSYIIGEVDLTNTEPANRNVDQSNDNNNMKPVQQLARVIQVQCFPLYSILLAIGRTQVDFFSLDVEGAEYKLLATIPWHKVDITALTVERNDYSEDEPTMTRLMESNKFIKFGFIELDYTRDVVYVKDFLADFRYLY